MLLHKVSFPIEVFETEFFPPYHRMDPPPTKRSRREPCFCSLCLGAERCYSTVLTHRSLLGSAAKNVPNSAEGEPETNLTTASVGSFPSTSAASTSDHADVASSSLSSSLSATGVAPPLGGSSTSTSLFTTDCLTSTSGEGEPETNLTTALVGSFPSTSAASTSDHADVASSSLSSSLSATGVAPPIGGSSTSTSLFTTDCFTSTSGEGEPETNPTSASVGSFTSTASTSDHASGRLSCSEEQLTDFVLRELLTKAKFGYSQSQLEEHLKNAAKLLGEDRLIQSYQAVLRLLKSLGYRDPKHYKVCIGEDGHSFLLKDRSRNPHCPICSKAWDTCIDYYVLGLRFEDWFLTDSYCEKRMAHWKCKEEWLNKSGELPSYSELWHGSRFRELSYFWDPAKETVLPYKCPSCDTVVPASNIESVIDHTSPQSPITIVCTCCAQKFTFTPEWMTGDPRNQAIIAHYDGWNPNNTSSRNSIASLTISPACSTKADRAMCENASVYSFIPVSSLPPGQPHKYDSFLRPLIDEIEELYIDGQEVFFKSEVSDFSPANDFPTLRALVLLVAADSKAHAELGLTKAGGKYGCRRCGVEGTYVASRKHYYYGDFHRRFYHPAEPRTAEKNRANGKAVDDAPTRKQQSSLSLECGVNGESVLYRLYDLYGFDPVQDLVIDAMHAIVLNLISREFEHLIFASMGSNEGKPVQDRNPREGGVLCRADFIAALSKVPWTNELRDGRLPTLNPKSSSSSKLGNWKAEEFSKFAIVAPVVLAGIIPKQVYACFMLLVRIYSIVYSHYLRYSEWQTGHITYLSKLLWKHAITYEELYGLSACTENLEYALHLPEDIRRHSTPDNYWCYVYERLVKYYKRQTTNQKNIALTYITRAAHLQFASHYFACKGTATDDIPRPKQNFAAPILLRSSTIQEAFTLKEFICSSSTVPPAAKEAMQSGIVIGSGQLATMTDRQLRDIKHWVREDIPDVTSEEFTDIAKLFSKILLNNEIGVATVYRIGDVVAIRDTVTPDSEWVMELKSIILYGPVRQSYFVLWMDTSMPPRW